MRRLGYGRVSSTDQNLGRQLEALNKADCHEIFQEKISGKNANRPQLKLMLQAARPGDTIVVTKLDRLGRSLSDLIKIVTDLKERGIHLLSLGESIDTATPQGRLMFHLMGAIAEFERAVILERQTDGIAHAKAHGTKTGVPPGRPATTGTPDNLVRIAKMVYDGKHVNEIAKRLEIAPTSVYRYFRKLGIIDHYKQLHQNE